MQLHKLIFLVHCAVAILGHLFVVIMPIGVVKLILSNESMDFWVKGLFLGTVYFAAVYGVNHVGNSEGFCILTHLENYYRVKVGLPEASKRFVPRFHKAIRNLFRCKK